MAKSLCRARTDPGFVKLAVSTSPRCHEAASRLMLHSTHEAGGVPDISASWGLLRGAADASMGLAHPTDTRGGVR